LRVISKRGIRVFGLVHTQAKLPLLEWYSKMISASFNSFAELKKVFSSVDCVNRYTVFDIGGNSYRLIAAIHYKKQICYIRTIWTHAEYSKPQNQMKLSKGIL
jgi:mRNA interferase HigB